MLVSPQCDDNVIRSLLPSPIALQTPRLGGMPSDGSSLREGHYHNTSLRDQLHRTGIPCIRSHQFIDDESERQLGNEIQQRRLSDYNGGCDAVGSRKLHRNRWMVM
ncbi:hypothetical protein SCLCIDRAFT_512993 [Scleroderma citrinum Foug A]|uniref:Uncharacterized protein n=1 Tax=Scleroderma citrinum Foug A TaxID=1036808 RepID=A0A0C3A911_9AGAM|nr:hypothetical protein SCLCIDRAFT_512993 [Scleroderma citrinum Foug A]